MNEFSYHKPSSVSEAIALLAASGENRPLSGGMTLLPTMKQRLASPRRADRPHRAVRTLRHHNRGRLRHHRCDDDPC